MNHLSSLTNTLPSLTEAEELKRGELIATVLNVKRIAKGPDAGRFNTEWGTKTALGLFRTVARIVQDGE